MHKKSVVLPMFLDLVVLILAMLFSSSIRWHMAALTVTKDGVVFAIMSIVIFLASFYFLGVYRRVWAYAGLSDFLQVFTATTLGAVITQFISVVAFPPYLWRMVPLFWIISFLLLGSIRFTRRFTRDNTKVSGTIKKCRKTLIIGAGEAGALISRTLYSSNTRTEFQPVGFIDDDQDKQGMLLYGLPVMGTRFDIPEIVRKYDIDEVIMAIPTSTQQQLREITQICLEAGVKVKVLPSVIDIIQGKKAVGQVRELQMEDLLHRSEVQINLEEISSYLHGRKVLVTGAGGSIGSELCRQICNFQPRQLILLGRGENSIFEIHAELAQSFPQIACTPVIADIRDEQKISEMFSQFGPEVVFHAAAHKHVHFMEMHPDEAFKNNVFGTMNIAKMADRYGSGIFVLISTDKAVNPRSVMGLTKLIAEMIIRHFSKLSRCRFVAVRFGNVLGSRGSVVQLFRKQIEAGGPVTVTHPEMRRYFMTIKEAVQLVIQAGALSGTGKVYMLDMGDQIRVVDLARDMIWLHGLHPDEDIAIQFVGIRPGEKLSEELMTLREKAVSTSHEKIFVVDTNDSDYDLLQLIVSVEGFPQPDYLKKLMKRAIARFNLTPQSSGNPNKSE